MMKVKSFACLGSLALLAGAVGIARADVVYEQTWVDNGDNGPFSDTETTQQIADEFVLGADAVVTDVRFSGAYFTGDPYAGGETINVNLRFYADDGAGNPAITPFADINTTAVVRDTGNTGSGRKIYELSSTGLSVALSGGVRYYAAFRDDTTQGGNNWFRWGNAASDETDQNWVRNGENENWNGGVTGQRAQSAFALEAGAAATHCLYVVTKVKPKKTNECGESCDPAPYNIGDQICSVPCTDNTDCEARLKMFIGCANGATALVKADLIGCVDCTSSCGEGARYDNKSVPAPVNPAPKSNAKTLPLIGE